MCKLTRLPVVVAREVLNYMLTFLHETLVNIGGIREKKGKFSFMIFKYFVKFYY